MDCSNQISSKTIKRYLFIFTLSGVPLLILLIPFYPHSHTTTQQTISQQIMSLTMPRSLKKSSHSSSLFPVPSSKFKDEFKGHDNNMTSIINSYTTNVSSTYTSTSITIREQLIPPSIEYCNSKTQLGQDFYISLFKTCTFTFYQYHPYSNPFNTSSSSSSSNYNDYTPMDSYFQHFSCDAMITLPSFSAISSNSTGSSNDILLNNNNSNTPSFQEISSQNIKVIGWPDSCVANGPRCYSLHQYPTLFNHTTTNTNTPTTTVIFLDDNYNDISNIILNILPVSQADVASVDCSNDFHKAQQVVENLPQEMDELALALVFFAVVILVSVILLFMICLCGFGVCCGCCCGKLCCGRKSSSSNGDDGGVNNMRSCCCGRGRGRRRSMYSNVVYEAIPPITPTRDIPQPPKVVISPHRKSLGDPPASYHSINV